MTDRARVALIASTTLLLVFIVHILLIIALLNYKTFMQLQAPALPEAARHTPLTIQQRRMPPQQRTQQPQTQPMAVPQQQQQPPTASGMEEIHVGRRAGSAKQDPDYKTVPKRGGNPAAQQAAQQPLFVDPEKPASPQEPPTPQAQASAQTAQQVEQLQQQLQQLGRLAHQRAQRQQQQDIAAPASGTPTGTPNKTTSTRKPAPERLTLASFAAPMLQQGVAHDQQGNEAEGMDSADVLGDLRFKAYCDALWREIRNAYNIAQMYGLPKAMQQEAARKGLATTIFITINRNGTVGDVSVTSSSGDPLIDQFVVKALKNIGMLPPFPKALHKERIGFGVTYMFGQGHTSESIDSFKAW